MKERLEKEGKSANEAQVISDKFRTIWKDNLADMQVIDHRYFAGMDAKEKAMSPKSNHRRRQMRAFGFREREPTPPPDNVKPEEIKKEENEDNGELGSDDDDSEIEEMLTDTKRKTKDTLVCQYDRISQQKDSFSIKIKCGVLKVKDKEYCFNNCDSTIIHW